MIFGERVTQRCVLRSSCPEERVAEWAEQCGWDLVAGHDPEDDMSDYERIWLTDTRLTFHYVDDPVAGIRFVFLAGSDPATAAQYERELREALEPWSESDLINEVASAPTGPACARAVLRAASGAPREPDARFEKLIRAALRDPDPQMRKVGILAVTYVGWRVFQTELVDLLENDSDAEVRDMCAAALRAFERFEGKA